MAAGLFEGATGILAEAFQHARVSDDTIERLQHPKSVLKVSIPVRMDDGSLRPSAATASATTTPAGRPRAASASTPTSTSTRSSRWRSG